MVNLSRLLLPPRDDSSASIKAELNSAITSMNRNEFLGMVSLAGANHVLVRGLEAALRILSDAHDEERTEWVSTALAAERARIANAVSFLRAVCTAFEEEGETVTVIKSLDHWPDLGSDLDLYTDASQKTVVRLMTENFQAQVGPQSWGDRLACKWNFLLPGLPEAIEVHVGRLGQTGEQTRLAASIARRSQAVPVGDHSFRRPAVSDRLMISTLQRMYRHFYFRLCDVIDTTSLDDAGAIDYEDLRSSAKNAGIWEGVAAYLKIVSDYVEQYRGTAINLPHFVIDAARFGGEKVRFQRDFLRVPILPESVSLYGVQLSGMLRRGELRDSARLSLLPGLAVAAAIGQKITGSDKGIW